MSKVQIYTYRKTFCFSKQQIDALNTLNNLIYNNSKFKYIQKIFNKKLDFTEIISVHL